MKSEAATVDEYLQELPTERRVAMVELRTLVHGLAPNTHEEMKYGMPVFGDICALASQKHYMALYVDVDIVESHRAQLGKLSCGKCCIRFRRLEDLPMDVIESILTQAVEIREQGGGSTFC